MMKRTALFLLIMISFLLSACTSVKNGQPSIKQGVFGKVVWTEGNRMPAIGMPNKGIRKPIQRLIKIHELTSFSQVEGEAPLFSSVKTKLIKTVKANRNGYYQAKLLPGKYSIFTVEEEGKLFANVFDGQGLISVVEVQAHEVVTFTIQINYKAYD